MVGTNIPASHWKLPAHYGKIAVCLQRLNHQPTCSVEKSMKMQKRPSDPCVHPSGCRCVHLPAPAPAPSLGRGNRAGQIGACCRTNCQSCCCGDGYGSAARHEAAGLHGRRSGHRVLTVSAECGCASASTGTKTRRAIGYGAASACGMGSDSRCSSFAHDCGSERESGDVAWVLAIHGLMTRSGCGRVGTAGA